jgi:hypothetical protein
MCLGPDCMMWEFWFDPSENRSTHGKDKHGIKDEDKLGYCGLSKRRT